MDVGSESSVHNSGKRFESSVKFNITEQHGVDQQQTQTQKTTTRSKKFELLTAQSVAQLDDISEAKKKPVLNRISMFLASKDGGNTGVQEDNIGIPSEHKNNDITHNKHGIKTGQHINNIINEESELMRGGVGGFGGCDEVNIEKVEMEVKNVEDEDIYEDCGKGERNVNEGEMNGEKEEGDIKGDKEEEERMYGEEEGEMSGEELYDDDDFEVEMRPSKCTELHEKNISSEMLDEDISFYQNTLPSKMSELGLFDKKRQSKFIKDRLSDLQRGSESWRKKISPDKQLATLAARNSLLKKNPLILTRSNEPERHGAKEPYSKLGRSCFNISSCKDENILARDSKKPDVRNADSSLKAFSKPASNHFSPLSERLMRLEESQDKWTNRSSDVNDAYKFTVAEKMKKMGVQGQSNLSNIHMPSLRPASMIECSSLRVSKGMCKETSRGFNNSSKRVKVPRMEDDVLFETSFHRVLEEGSDGRRKGDGGGEGDGRRKGFDGGEIENFDDILRDLDAMPVQRLRHVKKVGRKMPFKMLITCGPMEEQYVEVQSSHVPLKKVVGQGNFAREALAGLASKEDLSQKMLKKATTGTELHQPYKHPLLIHFKGRRECQARLVEPLHTSLNSGDCFVLVTKTVVYVFIGTFSNIIERTKARDLANHVRDKHDLGVASDCTLVTIEEGKNYSLRAVRTFWSLLGASEPASILPPGPSDEDELFEAGIVSTNEVYRLHEEEGLQRVAECSGTLLTHQILTPQQVLLFDFGSEMYTWVGKKVDMFHRKKVLKLALERWEKGFDYSQHLLNPIHPFDQSGSRKGLQRPDWCLFGKLSDGLETILFKSKFKDFTGCGRVVRVTGEECKESMVHEDLKACDVEEMLKEDVMVGVLQLEGCSIGRGTKWTELVDGIKWQHEMVTICLEKWLVGDKVDALGDFHEEDTYVIKWVYMLNQLRHNLKGERVSMYDTPSKQLNTPKNTGRHRTAYFYWQGLQSSVGDKAFSALSTIELDVESAPQVRVIQGQEPSCFVGLFHPMIVHHGKMKTQSKNSFQINDSLQFENSQTCTRDDMQTKKLFILRNELEEDAYLQQVRCDVTSLRSRTSFLLVDLVSEKVLMWHGCKSSGGRRAVIVKLCVCLRGTRRLGVKLDAWSEVEEGQHMDFFNGPALYSLINDPRAYNHTPRLLRFTSLGGVFMTENIIWHNNASYDGSAEASVFPFYQHDLYNAEAPAFFLVDNHHEAYLWQALESPADVTARSKQLRRLAIESTIKYCTAKNPSMPCYLVSAGLEPPSFKVIFPTWSDAHMTEASQALMSENMQSLTVLFSKDICRTYSLDQLLCRPDQLDDLNLEKYLDSAQFQQTFGMDRSSFDSLPMWKQIRLKQGVGLF